MDVRDFMKRKRKYMSAHEIAKGTGRSTQAVYRTLKSMPNIEKRVRMVKMVDKSRRKVTFYRKR